VEKPLPALPEEGILILFRVLFEGLNDAVDFAGAGVELGGDVAGGVAFGVELGYALVQVFGAIGLAEVVAFSGVAVELEVQAFVVSAVHGAEADVALAVYLGAGALFNLFEVVAAGTGVAFADGEGAICKVDEVFAALEVVDGDGFAAIALGGVGEDEHGELVLLAQGADGLDELAGAAGDVGFGTEAGDVIDDEDGGFGLAQVFFDLAEKKVVVIGVAHGIIGGGVVLGAEKVFAKVEVAVGAVVIARGELLGAELEIDVEHAHGMGRELAVERCEQVALGQAAAELNGEDGFAHVGVGKEDAEFVLVPEVAEEHAGPGFTEFFFEPLVGSFGLEELGVPASGHYFAEAAGFAHAVGKFAGFAADQLDLRGDWVKGHNIQIYIILFKYTNYLKKILAVSGVSKCFTFLVKQ